MALVKEWQEVTAHLAKCLTLGGEKGYNKTDSILRNP